MSYNFITRLEGFAPVAKTYRKINIFKVLPTTEKISAEI